MLQCLFVHFNSKSNEYNAKLSPSTHFFADTSSDLWVHILSELCCIELLKCISIKHKSIGIEEAVEIVIGNN